MTHFKTMIERMLHLINEAQMYAGLYGKDEELKDIYYTLAMGHLDMANKVKVAIASYLNKEDHPDERTVWMQMKDIFQRMCDTIKEELM